MFHVPTTKPTTKPMIKLGLKRGDEDMPQVMRSVKLQYGAFIVTTGVIIALTTLKVFFRIGRLWRPERQRVKQLELQPLDMFFSDQHWFYPLFETLGNISLFIPFGLLLFSLISTFRRPLIWVAALGCLFSLGLEITQYIFAVGRTDIDDLWCNTLGAIIGGWIAKTLGPRWHFLWTWLALAAAAVFLVLVIISNNPSGSS